MGQFTHEVFMDGSRRDMKGSRNLRAGDLLSGDCDRNAGSRDHQDRKQDRAGGSSTGSEPRDGHASTSTPGFLDPSIVGQSGRQFMTSGRSRGIRSSEISMNSSTTASSDSPLSIRPT